MSVTGTEKSQRNGDTVAYGLGELYARYGYSQYKMSKFEEYDLYVRNKSFLLSDHMITFTDTDGKLMALKPDVTLSIVKNSKERAEGVSKVYYNENVYRIPRGAPTFKEIMQTGLECIGQLDAYSITEVLSLAAKSLEYISEDYVLDVSDLGILSQILEGAGLSDAEKEQMFGLIGEKNVHGIKAMCNNLQIAPDKCDTICRLVSAKGDCDEIADILADMAQSDEYGLFFSVMRVLKDKFGDKVRIDFSVVGDIRYYNGIVFKGFVSGLPRSILSGGRYDLLMQKMGKRSGAIGFAVYLDEIDTMCDISDQYDADVFVQYSDGCDVNEIYELVEEMIKDGKRVMTGKSVPSSIRYGRLIAVDKEEV
jgi:ATP phosphoribosyltransferase regulatory subunit